MGFGMIRVPLDSSPPCVFNSGLGSKRGRPFFSICREGPLKPREGDGNAESWACCRRAIRPGSWGAATVSTVSSSGGREQARWTPRKARLHRGALAGVSNSVVVRRGVVYEAPSARRAGGNERGRQLGLSRARARSCRRKTLLRAVEDHVFYGTQT